MKMETPRPDVAETPSPELVAFFVRWVRGLHQWKQLTLASFAGVSLTTVERVERAEKVSDKCLDRIAVALGYEAGYLTAPRVPLPQEEAIANFLEAWENLVPVPVRRLCTQSQVRQLGKCHGFLIHRPGVDMAHDDLISELAEWLDLASFIIGCPSIAPPSEGRRRRLYTDILGCIRSLEQNGMNVLSGVMDVPQPGIPDWKEAVVAITPKQTDPGAPKRRAIFIDRRCVQAPADWPRSAANFATSGSRPTDGGGA